MIDQRLELARHLAARFSELPQVEAVSLTGSHNSGVSDARSDIDLYVFVTSEIPVTDRMAVATPYDHDAEFDNRFWGTADSWHDLASGVRVEGIYWTTDWIEGEIDRVLRRCEPSMGYSTCFWYSVRNGRILFDRNNWLHLLQSDCQQPFPDALQRAIIAKNHPTLRRISTSYLQQLKSAEMRGDVVSLCHRCTALLEGYFDVLFAINRQPHPGEKRLLHFTELLCEKRPPQMREQVTALVAGLTGGDVAPLVNALIDGLDDLLRAEGFDPEQV